MNEIKIETVQGGVIGTNTYLIISGNNCFVVDCVVETFRYIQKNNLIPDYIFITHIHYDHIEYLAEFLKEYKNTKVIINENGYKNINDPVYTLNFVSEIHIDENRVFKFNEKFVMNYSNFSLHFLNTPGHSMDSSVMYIPQYKVVFSGDTIFYQSIGRTDLIGGNLYYLKKSIRKLFEQIEDDYTILPGHGEKTTVEYEKKYNYFISSLYT